MLRVGCLLLTVLTGVSGLVYEVTWQRYLATLLGSHGEATAAVLAIFLGGLSLGYAAFARLATRVMEGTQDPARPARLLRLYGGVELGVGVYALLFPILFSVAQVASLWVPRGHPAPAFAFDVMLSALLIGPPAVLMGGTIPLLTQALAGDLAHATRVHAWVYGCNTFGAFIGALLGGIVLVPRFGLDGTSRVTACANLVAGAAFVWLAPRAPALATAAPARSDATAVRRFGGYAAVALLAGFAMMTLQTTLNRLGALSLGASQFTFAMIVAVFVLCIALGSLAVSALPRIPPGFVYGSLWLLVALLVVGYPFVPDLIYWSHALRVVFRSVDAAFYPFQALVFASAFALLVVPIGLSGALLPLLFHQLRNEVSDLGATAGRLYAWNTVGSLLGALLGGYLLLIWLDLHHVYRIAVAALAVAALILTLLVQRLRPRLFDGLVLLAVLGLIAVLPAWDAAKLTAGAFRRREPQQYSFAGPTEFFAHRRVGKLVYHDDDPTTTVSVIAPYGGKQGQFNRAILVNGKSDGSIVGDYTTMGMLAMVPALMADRHERCFVIGWGTGVSTGELAALRDTREVQVAEISQGVLDAAPLFSPGNLDAVDSPKVRAFRGDAYRTLLQSQDRYDVIVSEPSNPWVTGVEMLYSVEFLEAARDHLNPGGIYAQWFHLYETDRPVVELVLRTYAAVFPHVSVWYTEHNDVMLIGALRTDRALDVRALEERFGHDDFRAGFARVGIEGFGALLAHELLPMDTLHAAKLEGPLHTLRHPLLSDQAARAFFRGDEADLPKYADPESARVGARNSLVRLYAGEGGIREPLLEEVTRETCGLNRTAECATLFAAWKRDYPRSERLSAALADLRRDFPDEPELKDDNLDRLIPLFGAGANVAAAARPLIRANRVSQRFLYYYHYPVPFDRRVLENVWSHCKLPLCEEPRRRIEAQVGPLGPAS
jgi:predicted membrane-bound spermidine synthase